MTDEQFNTEFILALALGSIIGVCVWVCIYWDLIRVWWQARSKQ